MFFGECDPIRLVQACMESFQKADVDSVVSEFDIFIF